MENDSEFVLKMLTTSNKKDVERDTNIPADRIYKWLKGKGNPKPADLAVLLKYFRNGTNSESNTNITLDETFNQKENRDMDMGFSDVKPINQRATYLTNSTFPDKPPNEMWELVNIQSRQIKQLIEQNNGAYQQINLLYNQIELLNNLLQKQHEKIEGH